MTTRRFDAHCHVFDLDYLLLEAGNMLWDELCGRYPSAGAPPRELEAVPESRVMRFLRWLRDIAGALEGPEARNLDTVLGGARAAWGGDAAAIALMMDVYYLFAEPLQAGQRISVTEAAARPLTAEESVNAQAALERAFDAEGLPPEWKRKVAARAGEQRLESRSGPFDTWGFRHHRRALEALVPRGDVYPFLAIDPRRPGAIEAVLAGGLVGRRGPFFGIKLYPRLGYHPDCAGLAPLFDWCHETRTPVVTHCGPGGFPPWDNGHGPLGDPANYAKVLAARPSLRIDFAHLGSMRKRWADTIVELMGRFPGQVFGDLSCYTAPGEPQQFLDAHREAWRSGPLRRFTMLGTDYDVMILTRVGVSLDGYYRQFQATFSPAELDDLTATVPAQFLGA